MTAVDSSVGALHVDDVERSDDVFRAWMRGHLARAAAEFEVTPVGGEFWGWCLRSVGVPAQAADGRQCWLRVGTERTTDVQDPTVAAFWRGIPDSSVISGVVRPDVLASTEWDEPGQGRMVRADLTTRMPGRPCSATDVLTEPVDLPDTWWRQLRSSVDRVSATPTARFAERATQPPSGHVLQVFGPEIADRATPTRWATAHGDLHWSNLLCEPFGLLDWEMWGCAPADADAATLYTFSLLVPTVAARVHEMFADILDSPDGRRAQVRAAARVLIRAEQGDYPQLAPVVRQMIQPVLTEL